MTITVNPTMRMRAASFPTNAASLKMVCTIPGQTSSPAPIPRYITPFNTVNFDVMSRSAGRSVKSLISDIFQLPTAQVANQLPIEATHCGVGELAPCCWLPPGGLPPKPAADPYLIVDAAGFQAPATDHERSLRDRAGFGRGSFARQYPKRRRKGGKRCAGNENPTVDYHAAAPFPASSGPCTKYENWKADAFPPR